MKNYKDLLEEYRAFDQMTFGTEYTTADDVTRKAVVKELIKYKAARASLARIYVAKGKKVEDVAKELNISVEDVEYFNSHEVSFEMQREDAKKYSKKLGGIFETINHLKDLLEALQVKQNPVMKPEHSITYIIHLELYEIFQNTHPNFIYFSRSLSGDMGSYMLVFSKENVCNIWAFYSDTKLKFVVECF